MEGLLYPEAIKRVHSGLVSGQVDWRYLSGITGDGPIKEFEETFKRVAGGEYAIACSNATSALFTALMASGIGSGDEVILPSYTWPQTLAPILLTGATPVFADIGGDIATISPESIQRLITKRTRAIVAVHIFGIPADIDAIEEEARKANCITIYDAAQGFGALYNNRPVGSFGNFTAFSFGRGKLLSAGEGGALICNDREGYERAISFSQHPLRMHREIDDDEMRNSIDGVSMNFRIHPLVALLALGQLEGMIGGGICRELKERFYSLYEALKNKNMGRVLPAIPQKATASGVTMPLIVKDRRDIPNIDRIIKELGFESYKGGVQTPLHMTKTIERKAWLCQWGRKVKKGMTVQAKQKAGQCPNTEKRCGLPQLFIETKQQKN